MKFIVIHNDSSSKARACELYTHRGVIETPVFMPVGTQGTVKTLTPEELVQTGTTVILNNTYHLFLRPGPDLLRSIGGVHRFSGWDGPIVTDSGGYQVFSLADLNSISDGGVRFRSHLDGSWHFFTPELIIDIQKKMGADIIMPLDRPAPYPLEKIEAQIANRITIDWVKRSRKAFKDTPDYQGNEQTLFGIVQGSVFPDLRTLAINETVELDFPGYAIGGLSVGEPKELLHEMTDLSTDILPKDKPRYLMGVGKPDDIVRCMSLGIDMFDCVLPTRVGRNGWVFTRNGRLVVKNASFKDDFSPIDGSCGCYGCRNFSRAYIRHLFNAGEMLGPRLASLHNITFYQTLMNDARNAIRNNTFDQWKSNFFQNYETKTLENAER